MTAIILMAVLFLDDYFRYQSYLNCLQQEKDPFLLQHSLWSTINFFSRQRLLPQEFFTLKKPWRKAKEKYRKAKEPKCSSSIVAMPRVLQRLLVLSYCFIYLTFLGTKHLGFTSFESYIVLHIAVAQQIIIFRYMKYSVLLRRSVPI